MYDLVGRRYVVTGGSSGIGLEAARQLVAAGAEVCIVGRRSQTLDAACTELGAASWSQAADLSSPNDIEHLGASIATRWPSIDGLVNNAGIPSPGGVRTIDAAAWDECFAVNARGPYLATRALLHALEADDGGAVVNVSSTLAEKAIPGMVAYNAAKAALNQLTRSLALELAPAIRVNAVMPAVVDTPIHARRGLDPAQVQGMGRLHPLQRIGNPTDIAAAILFLLSDEASWITGVALPVDGGMMAT